MDNESPEKVIVVIDGNNVASTFQERVVDLEKLFQLILKERERTEILCLISYHNKLRQFRRQIAKIDGTEIIGHRLSKSDKTESKVMGYSYQKVIYEIEERINSFDTLVLFTHNGAFVPFIEKLKRNHQKKVEICAFGQEERFNPNLSKYLVWDLSDSYILELIEKQS